ncbi:MAG: DUF5110 domain-containing protein, partial [bacterium]
YINDPASSQDVLFLECYPEGASEFVLYEDDGATYGYENGIYAETRLRFADAGETLDLQIDGRTGAYAPAKRDFQAVFHSLADKPLAVRIDGTQARETDIDSLSNGLHDVWAYGADKQVCMVRISGDGRSATISVTRGLDTTAPAVDTVYCVSPDSVVIQFTERVLSGNSENSATNATNYRISNGIDVLAANMFSDGRTVALLTTSHAFEVEYQIDIFNIADQSPQNNLMGMITKSYSCASTHTVVLQQGRSGYSGVTDTHIAEYFPDRNMGGNPLFEAGRYDGANFTDDKSMLIRFNLSALDVSDSGSIVQAKLILTFAETRNGTATRQLAAHRLLHEWNAGNANAGIDGRQAQSGETTWVSAMHGASPWRTPGGDFALPSADVVAIADNPGAVYTWEITPLVKFWITFPDSNFGLILREPVINRQNGSKVFFASEHEEPAMRPKLEILRSFVTDAAEENNAIPDAFVLYQNFPNPILIDNANGQNFLTTIRFDLPTKKRISLKVYNVLGQVIATLAEGLHEAGSYSIPFRLAHLPSGIYFYRIDAGDFAQSRRLLILQ